MDQFPGFTSTSLLGLDLECSENGGRSRDAPNPASSANQIPMAKPLPTLIALIAVTSMCALQCQSSPCSEGGASLTTFFTPAGCVLGASGTCLFAPKGGGGVLNGYIIPCDASPLDPSQPAVLLPTPGTGASCNITFICADRHQETVEINYVLGAGGCITPDQTGTTVCATPCVPISAGCATDAGAD